jgi:uncharacterized protein YcbX
MRSSVANAECSCDPALRAFSLLKRGNAAAAAASAAPSNQWRDEVYFGQNVAAAAGGVLRVGDQLEVTAKQPWVTWGL